MKIGFNKILSAILAVLLLLSVLCACGEKADKTADTDGTETGSTAKDSIKIVATVFPQYDFTRQLTEGAGNGVKLDMLLKLGSEAHSYEPSPSDIIAIQNCDLFINVGGESEAWAEKILVSLEKKPEVLSLMDVVTPVEEETVEGMEGEEETGAESGEGEPEYDEHVWTSPANAILIVRAISEKLCELDEANAALYRENTETYVEKLTVLDKDFADAVSAAKTKTLIFGDRFPFRYFVDEFGLNYYAAFPGCSSQTEASASTIVFLIDKVKENKIPVIFTIDFSNEKIARTISEATGAEILTLYSCHTVSADDMKAGVTYLNLMEKNLENVRKALGE